MMSRDKSGEEYDEEEAQRRFEAALRGAANAKPKPMKDAPRKRGKGQQKAGEPQGD